MANYELNVQLNNNAPVVVNFDKLKYELSTELLNYKEKVYTETNIVEAKNDRANLNKFKEALDNERKIRKKEFMQPFEAFEVQIKELCSIIDEVTTGIGTQLETFEQKRVEEKRVAIRELFSEIAAEYDIDFITLEKIYNPKWENKTATDKTIATEIDAVFDKAVKDLEIISKMPNYSFEAKEAYKASLDLNKALAEGERMAQVQEAKRQEALRKAQEEIEARKHMEELNNLPKAEATEEATEPTYEIAFKCKVTKSQAIALKDFCTANGIELQRIL